MLLHKYPYTKRRLELLWLSLICFRKDDTDTLNNITWMSHKRACVIFHHFRARKKRVCVRQFQSMPERGKCYQTYKSICGGYLSLKKIPSATSACSIYFRKWNLSVILERIANQYQLLHRYRIMSKSMLNKMDNCFLHHVKPQQIQSKPILSENLFKKARNWGHFGKPKQWFSQMHPLFVTGFSHSIPFKVCYNME